MTRLIDNISNLRDIFINNDTKKLLFKINLLKSTYEQVNRNIERFIKDDTHGLDFTSQDLIDMSQECQVVLNSLQQKINVNKMLKELMNLDKIDNKSMLKFTNDYADIFRLVAHLREFHNVICYSGCFLSALELQYQQGELDFQVIETIKRFLR